MRWITLLYFLLLPAAVGQTLARFEVFFATKMRLKQQPVTHGVTLDDGVFDGTGSLAIKGRGNPRGTVQFQVLLRYGSGSVKVLRVAYFANIPSRGRVVLELQMVASPCTLRGSPLEIDLTSEGVLIQNAGSSLIVPPSPHIAISNWTHARSRSDRSLSFISGDFVSEGELVIEEAGPLKAVIRQQGVVALPATTMTMKVDRRITVWRGRAEVDVETYFENDLQRGRVGVFTLSCSLPRRPTLLLGEKTRIRSRRGLHGFEITQPLRGQRRWRFPERTDLSKRGPPGAATLMGSSAGILSFAVRDQSWIGPHSVVLTDGRELAIDLVGARHYWREGIRAGVAVRLAWTPTGKAPFPRPFVDPVILPMAAPLGVPAELRVFQGLLDQSLRQTEAERHGLLPRGLEDAGDWLWSRDSPGNLEYDTVWGVSQQGLRSRSNRLSSWAKRSARHLINRDLDRLGTQLPLSHGPHHRLGKVELGHIWLEGLMGQAHRSADPFLMDGLTQVAEAYSPYVTAQNKRWLSARSIGWGLLSLAALYEAGADDEVRESSRHLLSALHGSAIDEWFVLSHRKKDGAGIVSTWVAAGIVGEGIHRSVQLGLAERVWVARQARFLKRLTEIAWDPLRGLLHSTVVLGVDGIDGPTVSGLCTGEEMLFFALGLLRSGMADGNAELLSTAREVLSAAKERMDLPSKKLRGKEVSQLAWLLPRLSECLR